MKARTHFLNGNNHYEVYFAYEDYYGGELFKSFEQMQNEGDIPNTEGKCGTLIGILHSFYWGTRERIDIMELDRKPTMSEIKRFMQGCYDCLKTDGEGHKKEDLRLSYKQVKQLEKRFA